MGSRIQKRKVGAGVARKTGRRGIVVEFDVDTFAQVRERALANDTSFAEQVRTLVEWGLESAGENEITHEECEREVRL